MSKEIDEILGQPNSIGFLCCQLVLVRFTALKGKRHMRKRLIRRVYKYRVGGERDYVIWERI
jgi:hypothetical protein